MVTFTIAMPVMSVIIITVVTFTIAMPVMSVKKR